MNSNNTNVVEDSTEFVMNEGALTNIKVQQTIDKRIVNIWKQKTNYWAACEPNLEKSSKGGDNVKYNARLVGGYIVSYDKINKSGEVVKNFKIAETYEQYVDFLSKQGNCNLYEVMWDDSNVKFYIDLDEKNGIKEDMSLEEHTEHCDRICLNVVDHFQTCLEQEFGVAITYCIQDSSGYITEVIKKDGVCEEHQKYKYSKHVVFNGIVFKDIRHVGAYFYKFVDQGGVDYRTMVANGFIDDSIYGDTKLTQSFRCVGQSKLGDTRILQLAQNTTFEDNLIVVQNTDNYVIFEHENIHNYIDQQTVIIKKYKIKPIKEVKNAKKRTINDNVSIASNDSKRAKNNSTTPSFNPNVNFERHEFNQVQHDHVLEMLSHIDPGEYISNKDFFVLMCMLKACDFTYEEYEQYVLNPYLDYILLNEGRESTRKEKFNEERYAELDCSEYNYTYSAIVSFCKKNFGAVINDYFSKSFSAVSNWYYHCKREFEQYNFCLSSTDYAINFDPISKVEVCKVVDIRKLCEMFSSWHFENKYWFAKLYCTDSNRAVVHNLFWKPLRNGKLGCEIYETTEEDRRGKPVTRYNYNTWTGFLHENLVPQDTPQNRFYLKIWERVIKNLSGHPNNSEHEELIRFKHLKFATIIQRPDELTKVAEYCSSTDKGSGKDTVADVAKEFLMSNEFTMDDSGQTRRHSYGITYKGSEINKPEIGLFGGFNSLRSKRLFVHVSEYESGKASIENFRSAITDEDLIGVQKHKGGIVQDNYAAFYVTGQDILFDCVDDGDRRWCLTNGQSKMEDVEYNGENIWTIVQRMKKDKSFITYLFHYYKNMPLPEVCNWKAMIPNTLIRTAQVSTTAPRMNFLYTLNQEIREVCTSYKNLETSEKVRHKKNGEEDEESGKYQIMYGDSIVRYKLEKSPHIFTEHTCEGIIKIAQADLKNYFKWFYESNGYPVGKKGDISIILLAAIRDLVRGEDSKVFQIVSGAANGDRRVTKFKGVTTNVYEINTFALNKAFAERNK